MNQKVAALSPHPIGDLKISFEIVANVEGPLGLIDTPQTGPRVEFPPLEEVLGTLRNLAFIVEMSPFLKDNQTAQNTVKDAERIANAFKVI